MRILCVSLLFHSLSTTSEEKNQLLMKRHIFHFIGAICNVQLFCIAQQIGINIGVRYYLLRVHICMRFFFISTCTCFHTKQSMDLCTTTIVCMVRIDNGNMRFDWKMQVNRAMLIEVSAKSIQSSALDCSKLG